VPASLQRSHRLHQHPDQPKVTRDQQTRLYFQADSTVYANMGRQPPVQVRCAGLTRSATTCSTANRASASRSSGTRRLSGQPRHLRLLLGAQQRRSRPRQGLITEGDISTTNIGLFAQDAWTINNKLTVNIGVRTERERVPTYTTGADIPEFGIEFGFGAKLGAAPRLRLRHQWRRHVEGVRLVGHVLRHLQARTAARLVRGDKWLEYYYTLDNYNWNTLVDKHQLPARLLGHAVPHHRLPPPVVRCGLDRAGPEADEAAGNDLRPRPPVERCDVAATALRAQAG
jgi:outer membrane receptor protein involved in Fe transport